MGSNAVTVIVVLAVGGLVAGIGGYYLIRFMRGSMKLFLQRTAFHPGEKITGSFEVLTKKPIEGNRLMVSLIGVQVTVTYRNGKRQTHSEEIYRDDCTIEGARTYRAGERARYDFTLTAPNMSAPAGGSTLGQVLNLLSNSSTRLQWRVEARLDAKGVDLATATSISING